MMLKIESNLQQKQTRYQISDITDITHGKQKKDNPQIAEKKVIFDFLRASDNQKFHFRMLFRFIFYNINIYLEKNGKPQIFTPPYREKVEINADISDIRYQISGGKI